MFSQQPRPDEVISYDGGSTDNSLQIVQRFSEDSLRFIAAAHGAGTAMQKQPLAINRSFDASYGEIIFPLDDDDAFLPGKIAAHLEAFERFDDTVIVQGPLEKIDEHGNTCGIEFDRNRHQENYLTHIYDEHELNVYYPTSSLAFRREYLEKRLPLPTLTDVGLWPDAQLALIAPLFGRVVALPRILSQWRRHARSHTVVNQSTIYRLVRKNQGYFNQFCRTHRYPQIAPWLSTHHRPRWARHYFLPDRLLHLYRSLRWATLSGSKKAEMLATPKYREGAAQAIVLPGSGSTSAPAVLHHQVATLRSPARACQLQA